MSEAGVRERVWRQGWAAPGSRHDWVIRTARILLPAGILLLVLILAAAPLREAREINFLVDKKTAEKAPERMRLQTAQYRGLDNKGRPFTIDSDSAIQARASDPDVSINGMRAELLLDSGPATVSAPRARYNIDNQTVSVDGPVSFQSGDGYRLTGGAATIDLKTQTLVSNEALSFVSPNGRRVDSGAATINLNNRTVSSNRPVTFAAPDGYRLETGAAAVDVSGKRMVSDKPISGRLPIGTFTAGNMSVDLDNRTVVLGGRARLHIVQGALK